MCSVWSLLALCGMMHAQSPTPVTQGTQQVVPRLIRFAGQLKELSGTAALHLVGITFSLHRGQQDGDSLWIETQNVEVDASGKYTVLLGVTKPDGISADLFISGEAQWLGIQVQGQPEQPRVLLVSVPYALRAAEADTLAGHAATDFVTTERLASALQQQMGAIPARSSNQIVDRKSANRTSTPVDTATNFIDSTANQVVLVTQNGAGAGLSATAGNNYALSGTSTNTAIYASSSGATHPAAPAIEGLTTSTSGRGIFGYANSATGYNFGLSGQSNSVNGTGIFAVSTATSGKTIGLQTQVISPLGVAAIFQNRASGKLLIGESGSTNTEVFSVDGAGNISGASVSAAFLQSAATNNAGYAGLFAGALGGGTAVSTNGGAASAAATTAGSGIIATGGALNTGVTNAFGGDGGDFYGGGGDAGAGNGVSGTGGNVLNSASITAGVGGYFLGGGPNGDGIYSAPSSGGTGAAATLDGDVNVTGTLNAASKNFRIDDPVDPANKYLYHTSVESSEMINVYTGNVILGAAGSGEVKLPRWFEALNTDFRYQLTPIGAPGNLYISKEIQKGSFEIAGGTPGMKVSWTVTAVRHDAYALAHPTSTEVEKTATERGHYLHPELYGHPAEEGIAARKYTNRQAGKLSSEVPSVNKQ
jgi:hypothetical protein